MIAKICSPEVKSCGPVTVRLGKAGAAKPAVPMPKTFFGGRDRLMQYRAATEGSTGHAVPDTLTADCGAFRAAAEFEDSSL